MIGRGPWLQTAVLCEEIRDDGDGRIAALGVVDGIAIEPGERVSANLVIVLVRGGWVGPIRLRVVAFDPQGEPISRMEARRRSSPDPVRAGADRGPDRARGRVAGRVLVRRAARRRDRDPHSASRRLANAIVIGRA